MTVLEKCKQQFIQLTDRTTVSEKVFAAETAERIPAVGCHYLAIRMCIDIGKLCRTVKVS
jgi:hypothetical protein